VEVGPRDGLQNEQAEISIEARVALIESLADAGLRTIEAGSFVAPKWVPQMAGTGDVLRALKSRGDVSFPVLVPNLKGLEAAVACGTKEIAVFAAASETFSQRNLNCSIAESMERFRPVVRGAVAQKIKVRGYVSCVLGCPFEGKISTDAVAFVASQLFEMGCHEISLGDTIGVGTPLAVREMIDVVSGQIPVGSLAVHFHDTWGQALANILVALQSGVAVIDSSVAGLGGCPYAPGASGNVATEDVLYMLHGMGIVTGVDLEKIAATGRSICQALGRPSTSKAARALQAAIESKSQATSCFFKPALG
jgi:hydroxymethylglutaryl-CoA lyase